MGRKGGIEAGKEEGSGTVGVGGSVGVRWRRSEGRDSQFSSNIVS